MNLNDITKENFLKSFNLEALLRESVFYPASHIDGTAIELLGTKYHSFINVDYSTPQEVVLNAMESHFSGVGYDLVGTRIISKDELTPKGFSPSAIALTEHEKDRLSHDFIKDLFMQKTIKPFAVWSVYKLNINKTGKTEGKADAFSLLHIGGEACATFEALYLNNKINPKIVIVKSPGEGYGDNWTSFRDPKARLHNLLCQNSSKNKVPMPSLLTNMVTKASDIFWPNYRFIGRLSYFEGYQYLYQFNKKTRRPFPIRRTKPSVVPRPSGSFRFFPPE